ncbi:MAG: preprotein translocase subunit SecA [Propionibacteriaceae bacterium]|jgi:preprotein translocase subunit SecA|nr:preprotein translocase subunit SecA [Propionibacteriaceae bacterium]
MNLLDSILRMGEGKFIKRLQTAADHVASIEEDFLAMSDEQLREQTGDFRNRVANGETLDALLPEAFATVREASRRVLGKRHFDEQIMGGAALHWGTIAEMKTGEGKTLVAVLPSYLNALSGLGVHVVTVNDYLAKFQSEQMGRIHHFLGMDTGVILAQMTPVERRAAYAADITYGTNNEFGFDYLRDNMALRLEDCVQRGHNFAIVDEVDSILIDEARTPLIISGPSEENSAWYPEFARIADSLKRDVHYEVDEKKRTVAILEPGITAVEQRLGIDNLYESANTPLISFLNNSVKAKELFKRDKDYVVTDGEVLIVDEFTGRTLIGRRYSEGLHQALEAKEKVEIKAEYQTLATITLQNYFRMYEKLSGMTGTAKTEESEFQRIYGLRVLPIRTHLPMIREDKKDFVYRTEDAKFDAIVADVVNRNDNGQPVLIGTASVAKSEELSRRLKVAGVPHQVLNAKQHAREAAIVALAGRKGAVTVATNMAGRGTDIILGGNPEFLADALLRERGLDPVETPQEYEEQWPKAVEEISEQVAAEHDEVVAAGGLYVVGSERHESRRIDNQLRGRSGRQGDPGESRFYLSLQDDLMRLFKGDMVDWFMRALKVPDDVPIEDKRITKMILSAQEQVEAQHFETRKNVLKYDDVMNRQRFVVYKDRRRVLEGVDIEEQLRDTVTKVVSEYVAKDTEGYVEDWDLDMLWTQLKTLYPVTLPMADYERDDLDQKELIEAFASDAQSAYDKREEELGEDTMRAVERQVLLTVLDRKWREHLYEMDYLREGIGLRSMAQRDPLVEYQREGAGMFLEMMDSVMEEVVSFLFRIQVQKTPPQSDQAQPEPVTSNSRSDVRRRARQALAAEEAAARSEIHMTAEGLLAEPVAQRSQIINAKTVSSTQSTQTASLRESRPGAAGRRNKKKR